MAPVKAKRQMFASTGQGACAIGAAAIGVGIMPTTAELYKEFPDLIGPPAAEKVRAAIQDLSSGNRAITEQPSSLYLAITVANDTTELTREEIADILERNGL